MKLNNKGVTLVEIIISVALISIVLIFLFNLLIQVNNENSDNEVRASYLVNQSTFIKQIEEDFLDFNFSSGGECSSDGVSLNASSGDTSANTIYLPRWNGTTNYKCLTFRFSDYDNKGYTYAHLFLYQRTDATNEKGYVTILSYYRGDFKQSVELEDFDWDINNYEVDIPPTNGTNGMYAYSLPIIGPDYNDYSINLSYYIP